MEKVDHELILRIAPTDPRLQKLYDEHLALERQLLEFERSRALSFTASMEAKELKKQKLRGMDDIMSILNDYRARETTPHSHRV